MNRKDFITNNLPKLKTFEDPITDRKHVKGELAKEFNFKLAFEMNQFLAKKGAMNKYRSIRQMRSELNEMIDAAIDDPREECDIYSKIGGFRLTKTWHSYTHSTTKSLCGLCGFELHFEPSDFWAWAYGQDINS